MAVIVERLENGRLPFAGVDDPHADHDLICHEETESMTCPTPTTAHQGRYWDVPPSSVVVDRLLARILVAVRGQAWEETFWDHVLPRIATAIHDTIASDLLERGVSVTLLGHQPLSDRLLFRMIDEVDEALLTLAKRRYLHGKYTPDQFEEVLYAGRRSTWMFHSLMGLRPSHDGKAERLALYVSDSDPPIEWPKRVSDSFKRAWESR
ncbi:MAG: hypothetical protein ACFCBV_13545 [Phycisphaerales bacterium]